MGCGNLDFVWRAVRNVRVISGTYASAGFEIESFPTIKPLTHPNIRYFH